MCHVCPRRTAWMPCRRSHLASSKPFEGPGGAPQLAEQLQPGPLRRRSTERELEQDGLVGPQRSPAEHERPHPLVEGPRSRRLVDLDQRPLEGADPRREHAVVELAEPRAPPTPGDGHERRGDRRPSNTRVAGREAQSGEGCGSEKCRECGQASEVREREAHTERPDERMREANRHLTGSRAPSAAPCARARSRAHPGARSPSGTPRVPGGSRESSGP